MDMGEIVRGRFVRDGHVRSVNRNVSRKNGYFYIYIYIVIKV